MRISKLIEELQDILDSYGDVDVFIEGDGIINSVSQVSYDDYGDCVTIE